MNNFEKIKAKIQLMNAKEFAQYIESNRFCCYKHCANGKMYSKGCKCGEENCIKFINDYLLQEVEE